MRKLLKSTGSTVKAFEMFMTSFSSYKEIIFICHGTMLLHTFKFVACFFKFAF